MSYIDHSVCLLATQFSRPHYSAGLHVPVLVTLCTVSMNLYSHPGLSVMYSGQLDTIGLTGTRQY